MGQMEDSFFVFLDKALKMKYPIRMSKNTKAKIPPIA